MVLLNDIIIGCWMMRGDGGRFTETGLIGIVYSVEKPSVCCCFLNSESVGTDNGFENI